MFQYETPQMEVVLFDTEDVIATSTGMSNNGEFTGGGDSDSFENIWPELFG